MRERGGGCGLQHHLSVFKHYLLIYPFRIIKLLIMYKGCGNQAASPLCRTQVEGFNLKKCDCHDVQEKLTNASILCGVYYSSQTGSHQLHRIITVKGLLRKRMILLNYAA